MKNDNLISYEKLGNYQDLFLARKEHLEKNSDEANLVKNLVEERVSVRSRILFENINKNTTTVSQGERNPNIYNESLKELPVISITSIDSRLGYLLKTVESLLSQSAKYNSINIYLSDAPYLIDKGVDINSPEILDLISLGVNIYLTPNIGPYRKQIPVISQMRGAGYSESSRFITFDDDVIYPKNILRDLMDASDIHDAVISHRGRKMKLIEAKFDNYSKFSVPDSTPSLLNLGTGKNGILYKLSFFPKDAKFYCGPLIAPTADDLWAKWVTALMGVQTHILEPEAAFNPDLDFKEVDGDNRLGLFHVYNAKGKNDRAIESLENHFSIIQSSLSKFIFQ